MTTRVTPEALASLRTAGHIHTSVEVRIAAHTPPRRAIARHLLATSRPTPVDPDTAAEQALRLRREDAQARFNTLGLPRATRLSEVTP